MRYLPFENCDTFLNKSINATGKHIIEDHAEQKKYRQRKNKGNKEGRNGGT